MKYSLNSLLTFLGLISFCASYAVGPVYFVNHAPKSIEVQVMETKDYFYRERKEYSKHVFLDKDITSDKLDVIILPQSKEAIMKLGTLPDASRQAYSIKYRYANDATLKEVNLSDVVTQFEKCGRNPVIVEFYEKAGTLYGKNLAYRVHCFEKGATATFTPAWIEFYE